MKDDHIQTVELDDENIRLIDHMQCEINKLLASIGHLLGETVSRLSFEDHLRVNEILLKIAKDVWTTNFLERPRKYDYLRQVHGELMEAHFLLYVQPFRFECNESSCKHVCFEAGEELCQARYKD